jgi:hypothetical protein
MTISDHFISIDDNVSPYDRFKKSQRARHNGSMVEMGAHKESPGRAAQQLGEVQGRRHMPKNRQGLQDEWGALIALQNDAMLRREQADKEAEAAKKRQYLQDLQSTIQRQRKDKDEADVRRLQSAQKQIHDINRRD